MANDQTARQFAPLVEASSAGAGPSAEMRRFSAGMRVVTALLCTVLLLENEPRLGTAPLILLCGYCLWAAALLWLEATGRSSRLGASAYWLDVLWAIAVMRLTTSETTMLIVTLVHPIVLASIGYGVAHGMLLALAAAVGLLFDGSSELMRDMGLGWRGNVSTVAVLALVPAAALLARPMSLLRRRLEFIDEVEAQLDPRRGLEFVCTELVMRLRSGTEAEVVVLVLPSGLGAPAVVASREEGSFLAKEHAHALFERLLAHSARCPVTHVRRRWFDPRPATRVHGDFPLPIGLPAELSELAETLAMRSLYIVPLTRYKRQHGHFVFGYRRTGIAGHNAAALASAAPDLLRIIEQAALADQLQDEIAGHERSRIGRDLHDSAIQPYLGLKYAVEAVALRVPPSNPVRAELDSLAELVNGEVSALRDLISGLRTGNARGDSSLVPAVRRQVRRFAALFGIEVELDCPDNLPTSRALASSVFHMLNEALNNIRKHTAAQHVWLKLSVEASTIRLVVRDDAGSVRGTPAESFHPASLRDRAAELGGTVDISQPDGLNTELVIQVPI